MSVYLSRTAANTRTHKVCSKFKLPILGLVSFREILQYSNFINNQESGTSFSFLVIMYLIHTDTAEPKVFHPKRTTDPIYDNQWKAGCFL
jgi:hypothetical protein